jgi:uncharacterized membrane protein YqaE (UPF0057 family)
MKKITNYLAAVATLSIVLSSCTVEKRLHNSGFHVAWKKSFKTAKNENVTDEVAVKETRVKEVSAKNTMISTEAVDQINLESDAVSSFNETAEAPVMETATVATQEVHSKITKNAVKAEQSSKKINAASSKLIQKAVAKKIAKAAKNNSGDTDIVLLYVLCFVIPFVAVGLATDWDVKKVIINILLSCLCGIPGIIHALIVVKNNA